MSYRFNRFKKRVYQVSPPQTIWKTIPNRGDGEYGKQMFYTGTDWTCMNKTELADIKAKVLAQVASTDDSSEIYIKDKKMTIHMSNMESTNILVQIYHYKCKRDENQGPGAMVDNGIADLYGATTYTKETYGITPFQSAVFCKTYTVQKVYALELGAGRSHIHQIRWKIDKMLDVGVLTETDSDTAWMAGWTQGIFIIARGEPVNDNVTTPVDASVTPSPTALDFVTTSKATYHFGMPTRKIMSVTQSLATSGLTLTQMNEATGAETNVTEA